MKYSALDPKVREAYLINEFRSRPRTNPAICMCGHPMSHHSGVDQEEAAILAAAGRPVRVRCTTTTMVCGCAEPRVALVSRDSRVFKFKGTGKGLFDHALTRGRLACNKREVEYEWVLDPTKCEGCGVVDKLVMPYGIGANGYLVDDSAPVNRFLCELCREKLFHE